MQRYHWVPRWETMSSVINRLMAVGRRRRWSWTALHKKTLQPLRDRSMLRHRCQTFHARESGEQRKWCCVKEKMRLCSCAGLHSSQYELHSSLFLFLPSPPNYWVSRKSDLSIFLKTIPGNKCPVTLSLPSTVPSVTFCTATVVVLFDCFICSLVPLDFLVHTLPSSICCPVLFYLSLSLRMLMSGLAGKSICYQTWWITFALWDLKGRNKELMPTVCQLTSI